MTREDAEALDPLRIMKYVEVGDGAVMTIPDRRSYADGGPEWVSRYGDIAFYRYAIASLLESYAYLLSPEINLAEARRRLGVMRNSFMANAALQDPQP